MSSFIGGIISITVGLLLVVNVFITAVKGVNTSGWGAGEIAMLGVLSLVGIVGILYGTLQVFGIQ
jgi:hypothetical protein